MTLDEAREVLKSAMGQEIDLWHYDCGSGKSPRAYMRKVDRHPDVMGAGYKEFRASENIRADDPLVKAAEYVLRLRAKKAAEEETKGAHDD